MFLVLGGGAGDGAPELLIHRLCKFALKTINSDMGYLFEKFVPIFDVDMGELGQQGETHEQYAAYREYTNVLEQHLVRFVAEEGYGGGDVEAFLALLRQQVVEDAANVEQQFQKTWEAMKNQLGDMSELGPDSNEFMEQLRDFYRPPSVDDLMQTVLNMAEYQTFSLLMRRKVEKVRLMREMQRRKDEMMQGEMGLAHRFIEFATKVLNHDLEPFYKRVQPLFEQDYQELQQQGQTLEQYTAFQEFAELVENYFNSFIVQEGFPNDAGSFIAELQRLAQKDKDRLDAELQKAIEEVKRRNAERQQSSAAESHQEPVVLFCKPTSLGELIDYFVHFTEYENFSAMMRGRISEQAFMRQLFSSCAEAIENEAQSDEIRGHASLLDCQSQMPMSSAQSAAPNNSLHFAPPARGYGCSQVPYDPSLAAAAAAAEKLSVTVPDGCLGGSQLTVPTPDGQALVAIVPHGLTPGMTFEISYMPQG